MSKQVTIEELEEQLRETLEDVRNGESVEIVDGEKTIGTIEPAQKSPISIRRHDPAFPLQGFKPGRQPSQPTDTVDWLIAERERERSGKKYGL